jgi:hypothetical protein
METMVARDGPFTRLTFDALPARDWTLLVQGVNLVEPAGDALLRQFSFLPFARLDDLMVSYAAPAEGWGRTSIPTMSSCCRASAPPLALRRAGRSRAQARLPLKILRRFTPSHDETLAPGTCCTAAAHRARRRRRRRMHHVFDRISRARRHRARAAFLDFLRDELQLPGRYADADLRPVTSPAAISAAMHAAILRLLKDVQWDEQTVRAVHRLLSVGAEAARFLRAAGRAHDLAAFRKQRGKHGVRLDLRSQLLYDDRTSSSTATRCRGRERAARRCAASPTIERSPERRDGCRPRPPRSFTIGTAMVTSTPASPEGSEAERPPRRYESDSRPWPSRRRDRHAHRPREALDPRVRHRSVADGLERGRAHRQAGAVPSRRAGCAPRESSSTIRAGSSARARGF